MGTISCLFAPDLFLALPTGVVSKEDSFSCDPRVSLVEGCSLANVTNAIVGAGKNE